HDLTKVLTVYASNLSSLNIGKITQHNTVWHGDQFLRAVTATGLGGDCRKLKCLISEYTINNQVAKSNGLVVGGDKSRLQMYHW
ncbi:hypothetical protein BGZ92_005367, partial [Podila epicladia]